MIFILKGAVLGVAILCAVPTLVFASICSLFMWNSKYWDIACGSIADILVEI